jgi:hypothetical protein
MRRTARLTAVMCVATIAASDCGGGEPVRLPSQPSPTSAAAPPAPTTPTVRDIGVGEVINDDIRGAWSACTSINGFPVQCLYYALTAPAAGTLTATLSWNPEVDGNLLLLRMEETDFPPVAAPWSPIVGQLRVVAGQRYRLEVGLAGTDLLGQGPFVLTTAIN